jgi:PAS domain S-box-containing protein
MEQPLRILMVEDNILDAELIKREIKKNGILFVDRLVETKDDFTKAIQEFTPDIILSDYSLPSFDGMQALRIRQETIPEIPFILVTGSINEETAVEVMKAGADDYILKGHITRIGTAMKAAMEKKAAIRLKKEADEQLRILSRAVDQNPASIIITDIQGNIEYVNQKFTQVTGYNFKEVMGQNPRILKSGATTQEEYKNLWETIIAGKEWKGEFQDRKKNGDIYFESALIAPIANDEGVVTHFLAVKEDITERKRAEMALQESEAQLRKALFESSELIDVNPEKVDYQKIANIILDLSGAKYVGFNVFDENGLDFSTVALAGIKEDIQKASSFFGFEIINKKWKDDPIRSEKIRDQIITPFSSISELAEHVIPKPICSLIEKTFHLGEVSIVRIAKDNKSIGDFTLIYAKGEMIQNKELVSLFANQVGLFIERKRAEEALSKKMNELERFHRLTVGRELTMIELKKEVNLLLKEMGKEPKYNIAE